MMRLVFIFLFSIVAFGADAANTPPPGNTGNIITNGGSGRYDIYTVGPGLQVVGKELRATSSSSASPSGTFPQIQYNDGAGNFAPLTEYTAAAYAAHNTIMNGLAYDPRDTQYGALCGGFNLFSGNGTTATFNYTIPFTGSSSTDNSGFFVYIETNGFASATILTTADFTVTGVNSGVGGTITLNTPPVAGSTLIVVHDDGPGLIATSTASVASGGYISVPHGCTMYTDAAAGTALADNVQVIGQGFTPNYAQQEQTMKPILYVIAPTGHVPAVGFNISNKNKQFFEGFEITTHIPGASNQFGFQTVPALIGVVGNTGAGGGTLPGITAQYMTFNYGKVGFGAPKSGTAQYIFSTLRFNTFSGNDAGIYGPLSDQQIYGNNFVANGQFGTYGDSGGMVIGPQQGATGASGASRVEFNRFEFNLEGIVVKAGNLITMDGNEFDSNYGCGLDLNSNWSDININGGWFRASGTNGSNGTGNTTAGRDAHVCINGAGYNLHITGTNFLNGYLRGYQQPIGTASANTPLYFLDVNTAGSGVDNISVVNANIQNSFTGAGAYITDFSIYRNGVPSNLKVDSSGQAIQGKNANGKNPSQARGLPSNAWSSYYVFGDRTAQGSQVMSSWMAYPYIIGANMGVGPTPFIFNDASHFDCDIVDQKIFPNYNPTEQNNPLVTWLPGVGDPGYGAGFYQGHLADTSKCRLAALTWMGIASNFKTYAQTGTTTGSWGNFASYGGALGLTSTTNGSTLSITTTTYGGPIYLGYELIGVGSSTVSGGTFNYQLDGTTTSANIAAGGSGAFTFPISASSQAPAAVRIPVNSTGSHTINIGISSTTSTSNPVTILGIWTPPGNPYPDAGPSVFIGGQLYESGDTLSAATAAFNTDIKTQANQLFADGLAVNFVDVRTPQCCNTTTDLFPSGVSGYPLSPSAQGQQNIASAFGGVIQYQQNAQQSINPRRYGAACNAQILTNTYIGAGATGHLASTTSGSDEIVISNYNAQDGTATQAGGGGDVGKAIVLFDGNSANCDLGPATYVRSVNMATNKLRLGRTLTCSTNTGYVIMGGYPTNPNDPSTATDDTNAIHLASVAASSIPAITGATNTQTTGGGMVSLPPHCLVHNLILADHTQLVGNDGGTPYNALGVANNPGTAVTPLYVLSDGFGDDSQTGINISNVRNIALKNFTIRSVTFPYLGFPGLTLSCIGTTVSSPASMENVLFDHVTAQVCPVGAGIPFGRNLPVSFTASISGTAMTVSSIDSTNFNTPSGGAATSDWLALGRTVSGAGITTGTTITALPNQRGRTGVYTLSLSQTVTSESMISPAIAVATNVKIKDSLFSVNGIGWNGDLTDSSIDNTWWSGNFSQGMYVGPFQGNAGNCANAWNGGRFEENFNAITFDGGCLESITGTMFQFNSGPAIKTVQTTSNANFDIQMTGVYLQGNNICPATTNDRSQIVLGGSVKNFDVSGAHISYANFAVPAGCANKSSYLFETATGGTADYISVENGTMRGDSYGRNPLGIYSPGGSGVKPVHYRQEASGILKLDTTVMPVLSGLALTSTSGGIYSGGGLSAVTTSTGVLTLSGLPNDQGAGNWNCQGGDTSSAIAWPMSATTSTSCSLNVTTTSGNSVWWSGQARP